jgi:hypothetical protein
MTTTHNGSSRDQRDAPKARQHTYRSMYAESGCASTSHKCCVGLEGSEDQFVATAADPTYTLTRDGCLQNRIFVKAPERSRPRQEFLGSVIF